MEAVPDFRSIADALAHWTCVSGDKVAFRYLADGVNDTERYTYAELERAARRIAHWLVGQGAGGEPVLLAFPAGLEFVAALFGCFYAGAIAVPATLDGSSEVTRKRLIGIARDVKPRLALTALRAASMQEAVDRALHGGPGLGWHSTEELLGEVGENPPETELGVALIQYTSGSTSSPRGVVVRHAQLLANQRMIAAAFAMDPTAVVVSWLPHHHDMGLVGSILQTVYSGASAVLMPPGAFLRDPLRWLRAIQTHRGSVSGGPDFGFDYCGRRLSPEAVAALDLSSWTVAFNGAERVKPATLRAFAQALEPAGFSPTAFVPCYGLAEATLFVAAAKLTEEVATAAASGEGMPVVCCGMPALDSELAIVDPATRRALAPGAVGEIWVKGPHVADGYWKRAEETARTFRASTADGAGPYLRTGDLGFLGPAGLFVTGRSKDVIVVRGRNVYAEDVEAAVHAAQPDVPCAAIAVTDPEREKLVVLQEARRELAPEEGGAWLQRLREAVSAACAAWIDEVLLLSPGELPRTSSGKVRRSACRELLSSGELVPRQILGATPPREVEGLAAPRFQADGEERERAVASWLEATLGSCGISNAAPDARIAHFGLDSIKALELSNAIERAFQVHVPWTALARLSCRELASTIARRWTKAEPRPRGASGVRTEPGPFPLAPAQSSIWVMLRLWHGFSAYNLALACRVEPELEPTRVRRVLPALARRHPSLRSTFADVGGAPVQRLSAELVPSFEVIDAEAWSEALVEQTLSAMADDAFDLGRGPLLRFALFKRGAKPNVLLVVTHHLIADLWSVGLVLNDFVRLYTQAGVAEPGLPAANEPAPALADVYRSLPPVLVHEDWWRRELGDLPLLRLPLAVERVRLRGPIGTGRRFKLGRRVRGALVAFAREHGVTPCSVVLAVFQHVLSGLSRQRRFAVGCAYASRDELALADAAVPRADIVLVRTDISGTEPLAPAAMRAHGALLAAAEHQPMPLHKAAGLLRERDARFGPVQAVLVWQQLPSFAPAAFLPVLIGAPDSETKLGDLKLGSIPLPIRYSLFDLVLTLADTGSDVVGDVRQSIEIGADVGERVVQEVTRVLESLEAGCEEVTLHVP